MKQIEKPDHHVVLSKEVADSVIYFMKELERIHKSIDPHDTGLGYLIARLGHFRDEDDKASCLWL